MNSPAPPKSVLDIVSNQLCVGCGMCAGMNPSQLRMVMSPNGEYQPVASSPGGGDWEDESLEVCPFSGGNANEDEISSTLFASQPGIQHRKECGYFLQTFAGHVIDEKSRLAATSGGIITWVAKRMLETGEVDAVMCVGPTDADDRLYDYQIIESAEELQKCKKSRYYPVEVSSVIPKIRETNQRFLFIGLPCFVKSLHLAMRTDPLIRERVVHTIGLICGHLKTKKYAAYLARHCNVRESDVESLDFRSKIPNSPAHRYGFTVNHTTPKGTETSQKLMQDVYASSWGNNLFMLKACESCDDIFSETADLTVGDAWLNEFVSDYRGTSVVVCRTKSMEQILRDGVQCGEIHLQDLHVDRVINSQEGALRQRRTGLQFRLAIAEKQNQWRPPKRVSPNIRSGSWLFQITQRIRLQMAQQSKVAFAKQEASGPGLDVFKSHLRYLLFAAATVNLIRHLPGYTKRVFEIVLGQLPGKKFQ